MDINQLIIEGKNLVVETNSYFGSKIHDVNTQRAIIQTSIENIEQGYTEIFDYSRNSLIKAINKLKKLTV